MRGAATIFVLTILSVNAVLDQAYVEKTIEEIQKVGEDCRQKEGATLDDLVELANDNYPPSTHEGKCIIACFDEHYKFLKPDGTFDKQSTVERFNKIKAMDAELHKKILQVVDTCYENPTILDDRCETASAMAVCVVRESKALGIPAHIGDV